MAVELDDFVRVYDDVFGERYCNKLIAMFDNSDQVSFRNNDNRPRFYETDVDNLTMGDLVNYLSPWKDQYEKDSHIGDWLPPEHLWEMARIKKYNKNTEDQDGPHVDVGDRFSSKRAIALLIYLNDVEEGGETVFYHTGKTIKPKMGRLVMFPPLWTFPHQGKPVTSNDKYILSTYVTYV